MNPKLTLISFLLDTSEKSQRYQEADHGGSFLFHAITDGDSN